MATPFVEGRLRGESLSAEVKTSCSHCAKPIQFELDSDLNARVAETDAAPLVFTPIVDFAKLEDPSIIDAF